MANVTGATTCNSPKIKTNLKTALQQHLEKFQARMEDSQIGISNDNRLEIFGYDCFQVTKIGEPDEDDTTDEFLKGIQPFLLEELNIQCISNTSCRFPFTAYEIIVPTKGKIIYKELFI